MICRDNGWMTLGQLDPSEDLIFILKDTLNIFDCSRAAGLGS